MVNENKGKQLKMINKWFMLTNVPDRIHLKFLGSTYVTLKMFVEKCLGVYQETFLGGHIT